MVNTSMPYRATVESDCNSRTVFIPVPLSLSHTTCTPHCMCVTDVPGTEYRIATISGSPDGCERAKKWVEDLINEVEDRYMYM